MRRSILLLLGALLALTLPGSATFAQSSSVTTAFERHVQSTDLPVGAELYQTVLDFEPGAWTVAHEHNGPSFNTVLEGEVTLRIGEAEQTFHVGEGWVDAPGVYHTAGNLGSTPARLIVSFVMARGVPPSTFIEVEDEESLPPEPTFAAASKMNAVGLFGPVEVIHRVIDVEANATVPVETQAGPSIVAVMSGGVSVDIDGTARAQEIGDSWIEAGESTHSFTAGDEPTRLVITTFARAAAPSEQTAGGN